MRNADGFNAYLRQQQEAAQKQQAAQQPTWWKAPEYDPSWASKLTRDPATGEVKALPGNDPTLVQKYLAWAEHQRGFLDKFAQNPIEAIKPGIEQIARQMAQEIVQQHLGGYQQQTQAQQVVEQNSAWIHERDAQGRLIMDPRTGKPALSHWGQVYAGYVREAENLGIRDVQKVSRFALTGVQRDYMAARMQQQQAPQQAAAAGEAAKQQFLQNAGAGVHSPNVGSQHAGGVNGAPNNPPPMKTQRDLAAIMLQNMQAAGFQPNQQLDFSR